MISKAHLKNALSSLSRALTMASTIRKVLLDNEIDELLARASEVRIFE
jgi:hypothetical protein